ncbi:hypothetical protein Rhopal_001649-T1 [Rhodotorula paludigena]|uniref:Mitochondrial outer membrane transport complex Sam37/metaxin N-terminal domain-containing protein n=1 Tax=Rhodotorula paludigena TaxID=86838 RepID=A0AAV5GEL7_9BASI|nr:hypothetical protein Rhopal_001649-T1 [Rhodotorula paludigena]
MSQWELHALPGSSTHDLASLDPHSLVAASYLQLLAPGDWTLVPSSDSRSSPSGSLPYLKHGAETYAGSAILARLLIASDRAPELNAAQKSDSRAFQSLLDSTVLPLVLHSLYSLPQNFDFTRSLLTPSLAFPHNYTRPHALRFAAKEIVDSTHPTWWGLGGETEREAEDERRRKKALLETGIEGIRERKVEERREGKERIKKTLGEGKIVSAARDVFAALESTLAASSTPYFFSSSSPTPIDAHLSALLSLVLYLPLPTPILADLINASFPRLWSHTALLRRTLWSPDSTPPPSTLSSRSSASPSLLAALRSLASAPLSLLSSAVSFPSSARLTRSGAPTAQERRFAQRRRAFFAVCAVGVLGWAAGTGQLPVPSVLGKWGRLLRGRGGRRWVSLMAGTGGEFDDDEEEDEEGEWEEDDEDDEEDDLDDDE